MRLSDLILGPDSMRDYILAKLRKIPGITRDYSGDRGPHPFTDAPDWLFPVAVRGGRFTYWTKPDGSRLTVKPQRWIPTTQEMRHAAHYGGTIPTFTDEQPWCDL